MGKIKELLKRISTASFRKNNPNSPQPIHDDEILSRFIFQKGQFNASLIKQAAFLPTVNPRTSIFETSVFRKTKLDLEYQNTRDIIEEKRQKKIKATALITASCVTNTPPLRTVPDETDHVWHAAIIDWPSDKNEQKQLALILANSSQKE